MLSRSGVIACGVVVLGVILASQLTAAPGGKRLQQARLAEETRAYRALGEALGRDLAEKAAAGSKALVVSLAPGDDRAAGYTSAMIEGLQASFGSRITISKHEQLRPEDNPNNSEQALGDALTLDNRRLNALLSANGDCNVLVCLMDVSREFEQTAVATRAGNGNALVGVFSRNPYQLGSAIASGRITACVVPRREFRHQDQLPTDDLPTVFNKRFILVSHKNIRDVAKENKLLFYVVKRLE